MQAEKDSANFIAQNIASDAAGKTLNFFITSDKKIIGTIGLREITSESALIGYWLAKEYQGKGITTQALQEIIQLAAKKR